MKFSIFLLFLVFAFVSNVSADLRGWALSFGKGSVGIALPAPNSANSSGKQYISCWVDAQSRRGKTHASVRMSAECAKSGYWRLDYKTDTSVCIMFGDVNVSGCPFTSFWTSKARVKAVNKGSRTEEYTSPQGVTFIGCDNGAKVEFSRDENVPCGAPTDSCKTMLIFSILSFLCPK